MRKIWGFRAISAVLISLLLLSGCAASAPQSYDELNNITSYVKLSDSADTVKSGEEEQLAETEIDQLKAELLEFVNKGGDGKYISEQRTKFLAEIEAFTASDIYAAHEKAADIRLRWGDIYIFEGMRNVFIERAEDLKVSLGGGKFLPEAVAAIDAKIAELEALPHDKQMSELEAIVEAAKKEALAIGYDETGVAEAPNDDMDLTWVLIILAVVFVAEGVGNVAYADKRLKAKIKAERAAAKENDASKAADEAKPEEQKMYSINPMFVLPVLAAIAPAGVIPAMCVLGGLCLVSGGVLVTQVAVANKKKKAEAEKSEISEDEKLEEKASENEEVKQQTEEKQTEEISENNESSEETENTDSSEETSEENTEKTTESEEKTEEASENEERDDNAAVAADSGDEEEEKKEEEQPEEVHRYISPDNIFLSDTEEEEDLRDDMAYQKPVVAVTNAEDDDLADDSEPQEDENGVLILPISDDDEENQEKKVYSDHGLRIIVTYDLSFEAKLRLANETTQHMYSVLSEYLLSYKLNKRRSWKNERYFLKGKTYARMMFRGKTLCICLAIDPESLKGSKYLFEDVSGVKKYAAVPTMMRLRSGRALRHTVELIQMMMASAGIEQAYVPEDNFVPFEPIDREALIEMGLIKVLATDDAGEYLGSEEEIRSGKIDLSGGGMPLMHDVSAEQVTSISDETAEHFVNIEEEKPEDDIGDDEEAPTGRKKGIVNIDSISDAFNNGEIVNLTSLKARGLVPKNIHYVKVLARGHLNKALTVKAHDFSLDAVKMIIMAGGNTVQLKKKQ